jgi:hypothetical protein
MTRWREARLAARFASSIRPTSVGSFARGQCRRPPTDPSSRTTRESNGSTGCSRAQGRTEIGEGVPRLDEAQLDQALARCDDHLLGASRLPVEDPLDVLIGDMNLQAESRCDDLCYRVEQPDDS